MPSPATDSSFKIKCLSGVPGRLERNESINISESEKEGGEEGNHTPLCSQLIFYFWKDALFVHFADVN